MPLTPFLANVPARHYLREWREKRAMSQDTLGKLCGTTGATISRYEKGDRGLPLDLLLQLFQHLDILPGQFFAPPEAPDLNTFALELTAKERLALLQTIEMATALTPNERSELINELKRAAFEAGIRAGMSKESPLSPLSTPDETVQ